MRLPFPAVWIICGLLLSGPASGQQRKAESVGAQREVQAISISLKTGWRGKKEVNETYGPPPGFVIVEHRVVEKKKDGNANYSISILPDNFTGITTEEVKKTYSTLLNAAAKLELVDYEAKLKAEEQELLKRFEVKSVNSGVITVRASIEGSGELNFVVYAKLINAATNVSLSQIHRMHMENLERLYANPNAAIVKDVLYAQEAWQIAESPVYATADENDLPAQKTSLKPGVAASKPPSRPETRPSVDTAARKKERDFKAASHGGDHVPKITASEDKQGIRPAATKDAPTSNKIEQPGYRIK